MSLNIKALAITGGILWGACCLLVGLLNLIFPSYGAAMLEMAGSVYPGYSGPGGFGSVIILTLYAVVDGAVCGALLAWLYNFVARGKGAEAAVM
jgi:hypothetical protein